MPFQQQNNALLFFSWVAKLQLDHWTKRVRSCRVSGENVDAQGMVTKGTNRRSPVTNIQRRRIVLVVTSIALGLVRLDTKLLGLSAQSLINWFWFPIFRTNWDVHDDPKLFAFSPGTVNSITKRSQSRLKFIKEQFWYRLFPYEFVNPTIKISLYRPLLLSTKWIFEPKIVTAAPHRRQIWNQWPHIFKFYYIPHFSYKRMLHCYGASTIKVDIPGRGQKFRAVWQIKGILEGRIVLLHFHVDRSTCHAILGKFVERDRQDKACRGCHS